MEPPAKEIAGVRMIGLLSQSKETLEISFNLFIVVMEIDYVGLPCLLDGIIVVASELEHMTGGALRIAPLMSTSSDNFQGVDLS